MRPILAAVVLATVLAACSTEDDLPTCSSLASQPGYDDMNAKCMDGGDTTTYGEYVVNNLHQ